MVLLTECNLELKNFHSSMANIISYIISSTCQIKVIPFHWEGKIHFRTKKKLKQSTWTTNNQENILSSLDSVFTYICRSNADTWKRIKSIRENCYSYVLTLKWNSLEAYYLISV